jgi:hypothetical protein
MASAGDDLFYRGAPSSQAMLDIFSGGWASRLPGEWSQLRAGTAGLFEDPRIDWAAERCAELGVPVENHRVVELGPLEGGHTTMLRQRGAAEVIAVESNRNAYLKCLLVKELLQLDRVRFLLGDATSYLRESPGDFDVGIACGILYHMVNPVELLELLCRRCRAIFIWTVCHDPAFNRRFPERAVAAGPAHQAIHAGFQHTLHRYDYGPTTTQQGFWGGSAGYAHWMEREEILEALRHFGFSRQVTRDEANPNGTAVWVAAARAI